MWWYYHEGGTLAPFNNWWRGEPTEPGILNCIWSSCIYTFSIIALVTGVSGVNRICPISIGLRKAQAMAPPVVLTMSKYMFMQKGAKDEINRYISMQTFEGFANCLKALYWVSKWTNQTCSKISNHCIYTWCPQVPLFSHGLNRFCTFNFLNMILNASSRKCVGDVSYADLQALRGILNLSIISSLWTLSFTEGLNTDTIGIWAIPNRARMPLLHSAWESVTKVACLGLLFICPFSICEKKNVSLFYNLFYNLMHMLKQKSKSPVTGSNDELTVRHTTYSVNVAVAHHVELIDGVQVPLQLINRRQKHVHHVRYDLSCLKQHLHQGLHLFRENHLQNTRHQNDYLVLFTVTCCPLTDAKSFIIFGLCYFTFTYFFMKSYLKDQNQRLSFCYAL